MIELTYRTAVNLLDRALEDRGYDHVYERPEGSPSCMYVHGTTTRDVETGAFEDNDNEEDWTPGCIVGYVLHAAGVPLANLKAHESTNAREVLNWLEGEEVLKADSATTGLLVTAQSHQDEMNTWGRSVAKALMSSAKSLKDSLEQSAKDRLKAQSKLSKISDVIYS